MTRFFIMALLAPTSILCSERSLSDYGGDVSQYMGMLKDSSAFSFRPSSGMMARDTGSEATEKSPGGDYGGDYGDYLNLLKGADALGFNPQSDVVASNQDLQTDVFGGGGMSGKFWDAYKGKSSFDSLDAEDADLVEELDITDDEDKSYKFNERQAGEVDQPEDRGKQQRETISDDESKSKFKEALRKAKAALLSVNEKKMDDFLSAIKAQEPNNEFVSKRKQRWDNSGFDFGNTNPSFKSDKAAKSDPTQYYQKELNPQSQGIRQGREIDDIARIESSILDIVNKVTSNFPDPVVAKRSPNMNFHNLTLYGLSSMRVCDKFARNKTDKFVGYLCLDNLSVTVDSVAGPGVPFKGRIIAIFKEPKLKIMLKEKGEGQVHVVGVHLEPKETKYVPTYDSSIPLNPWSKISMSGFLVAKVRKAMPKVVERTIAKLLHEAEKM